MSKRAMLWMVGLVALGFTYIAAVNIREVNLLGSQLYTSCKGMWTPAKWFGDSCSSSLPPRLGVLAVGVAVLIVCGYFAEKPAPKGLPLQMVGDFDRVDAPPKGLNGSAHEISSPRAGRYVCSCGRGWRVGTTRAEVEAHVAAMAASDRVARDTTEEPSTNAAFVVCPSCMATSAASAPWCLRCGTHLVPSKDVGAPTGQEVGEGADSSVDSAAAHETITPLPRGSDAGAAEAKPVPADFKTCPDCAEEVRAAARKCRFCGFRFDQSAAATG